MDPSKLADLSKLSPDIEALEQSYLETIGALQRANSRCNATFRALHIAYSAALARIAELEAKEQSDAGNKAA